MCACVWQLSGVRVHELVFGGGVGGRRCVCARGGGEGGYMSEFVCGAVDGKGKRGVGWGEQSVCAAGAGWRVCWGRG